MRRLPAIALLLLLVAGCSEPPQKELDQAQGALDAAKAAGADRYATDDYTAASDALQKAHDAVAQRDYRQALSYAIDARQRAQDAARGAADGKAAARTAVATTLADLGHAADQLDAQLKAAAAARVPARDLREPRATLAQARSTLQEARTALASGNESQSAASVGGVREKLANALKNVDAAMQKVPRRGGAKSPSAPRRAPRPNR